MRKNVNGIIFTTREIDVIACIANGRSSKAVASLLKISPHTVSVHIKNIGKKIGCSSQNDIINFIEKSDQYSAIHEYYVQLIHGNLIKPINKSANYKTDDSPVRILIGLAAAVIFIGVIIIFLLQITNKYHIRPNVPFITDSVFVDREDILKKIENSFNESDDIKIAVLVGQGGSGKTTIARRYLFSQKDDVIWEINAENEAGIRFSLDNLANLLAQTKEQKEELDFIKSIVGDDTRYTKLVFFIAKILKSANGWVMLFENVNDFGIIKNYFPNDYRIWGRGKIIVTSRNANIKNIAFLNEKNIVDIGTLDQEKKEKLFMNIVGNSKTVQTDEAKKALRNFLNNILSFPLDVSAAAYYIKSSGVSYDEYLKKIKIRDEIFDNSQSKLLRENLNYKKTRYSIITSVLDDIIGHRPEYKKIWLMICLLDSDDIPKDFLKTPECDTITDAFIHNLLEHSLIIDNGDTFGIHRITQEIGLQYIEEKLSDFEKIKYSDEIVNRMSCCEKIACRFYEGQDSSTIFGDRVKTARHLQSIMRKIQKLNFAENKKREYDLKLGLALFHCFENLKTTEFIQEFAEKIIRQNESENVLKDTDLAVLLEICASKCICSEKIDDAKKYLSRSMTLCKKLKFNNCIRVFCLSDCAALAVLEKNYDEAEKYLKEARQLLKNFQKSWQLQTAVRIFKRYCDCYKNCSEQSEEKLRCIVEFGAEILKVLDVNRIFHADSIFLIKKETAELCKKIENAKHLPPVALN